MKLQKSILKKIRSSRVKSIQIHPSKPVCVVGLYNGYIQVWSVEKISLVNEISVCEFPVRAVGLVEKNDWALVGTDEGKIYVYDINNLRKLNSFDAHGDFIRKIVVHHQGTEFLTCSDDSTIKLWTIEKEIRNLHTYVGHSHFVMDVAYYPKDTRRFISCSLDGTIKLWNKENIGCLKTYKGHISGVNSVAFSRDDDYFISGSDDLSIKVWDINNLSSISTINGHTNNINSVYFLENYPYIASCSEDGTYRLWDSKTFECKEVLRLQSGRVWEYKEKNNKVVVGTDEDLVFMEIKTGTSIATMRNKKIFFSDQNVLYSAKPENYNNIKQLSALDFYPSELCVSENGKLIAVVNEDKFTIYSSLGFRMKFSGKGKNFHFINNNEYVVLEEGKIIFYHKNEVIKTLQIKGSKRMFYINEHLIGVSFENRTNIYTSEGRGIYSFGFEVFNIIDIKGFLVIEIKNKILIYRVDYEMIIACVEQDIISEAQEAIQFVSEFDVYISSYCIDENLFIFTSGNKAYYIILNESAYIYNFSTISGKIAGCLENTLYIVNNNKIRTMEIDSDLLKLQNDVLRDRCAKVEVSDKIRIRAISFYESLGMHDEALKICTSDNQKFEILIKLNRLREAYDLADSRVKFERLGKAFLKRGNLKLATDCYYKAKDWRSLLFTDLLCDKRYLDEIAENTFNEGYFNYSFLAHFKNANFSKCAELLKDTMFYDIFCKTYLK